MRLYFILIFLTIFTCNLLYADVISVNSGGTNNITITPANHLEDFFFTFPYCGNGVVDSGETCSNCPQDVGACPSTPTASPSGGGGGGGASPSLPNLASLNVVPSSFTLQAIVGTNRTGEISITNIGNTILNLAIGTPNLNGIVIFNQTQITLMPNENKIVDFTIVPPQKPDIYTGKITFTSGNLQKTVLFSLNVNSQGALFDLAVDIADQFKNIFPKNKITAQISLVQAGLQQKEDIQMYYTVKDFNGNTYINNSETISVYQQKTYNKEFDTSTLPLGSYVIGAEAIYSGGIATASQQFNVIQATSGLNLVLIGEIAIAFILLTAVILIAKSYKKKKLE